MPDEKLSGEDERRLLDIFEHSSLNDYPNPDRVGCPGSEFLRKMAFDRRSIPIADPRLNHATHCSPCFREFVDFRALVRGRTRSYRMAAIAAIVLLALGISVYLASRRSGNPGGTVTSGDYLSANLDLKDFVLSRGVTATESGASTETLELPRHRLSLKITLPLASPPGAYNIQVLREVDKPLAAASGDARTENGLTLLVVKLDLSTFVPGKYLVGIRRESRDWTYYSVALV
jgi:hypothetical protein